MNVSDIPKNRIILQLLEVSHGNIHSIQPPSIPSAPDYPTNKSYTSIPIEKPPPIPPRPSRRSSPPPQLVYHLKNIKPCSYFCFLF